MIKQAVAYSEHRIKLNNKTKLLIYTMTCQIPKELCLLEKVNLKILHTVRFNLYSTPEMTELKQ